MVSVDEPRFVEKKIGGLFGDLLETASGSTEGNLLTPFASGIDPEKVVRDAP